MKLKKDSTVQKLRGAYYTPLQLANAMVGIFVADNDIKTILEPSCGDGVFIDSVIESGLLNNIDSFTAVEIELSEAVLLENRIQQYKKIDIKNKDFFEYYNESYKTTKYDLILGNPPYIRYQYLTESQREIQSKILTSNGMKSNKLINAWVAFLVACVQMLNENGRIAFVIPAEIMQVAYAEDLRLYLSNHLSKITLITFEKLVFPDIEQEVVVIIGEKGQEEKGIRIFEIRDLDEFNLIDLTSNCYKKMQHLKEKWTKYFTTSHETELIKKIRKDKHFQSFADCGIINVGITTGNNDYFSIDNKMEKEYDLSPVLLPLIGRSAHAHGIYFTKEDWMENVIKGKKAQLLNFSNVPYKDYPEKHKKYIKKGEQEEQNKGYKCSIRDRWYIVPSVWVPDAFFLRRNNLYPKFVLNQCEAVSTDTMHRIKFNNDVDPETLLLSYYNSISFAFTELCGRSYGGGVLEILPGEVGNIMLPKIRIIDAEKKNYLLQKIDGIVRKNKDIEEALDIVDEEILVRQLGIEVSVCKQFRVIWKKLQKRRLGRGQI